MRLMLTSVLLLLVACAPKQATPVPVPVAADETVAQVVLSVPDRIASAIGLIRRGDEASLRTAIETLQGVLSDEPSNVEATFNLGVVAYLTGDFSLAAAKFSEVTNTSPDLEQAWLYLGLTHERLGRIDSAIGTYRSGMLVVPDSQLIPVGLVSVYRRLGQLEDATAAAKDALQQSTSNLALYNELGQAYLEAGEYPLARFVFEKALNGVAGAETDANIQSNLARTFVALGDEFTAEFHYKKALVLDPQLVSALLGLSEIYLDKRNYKSVVPLLEDALKSDPTNFGMMLNLGVAYRGVGRIEDAVAITQKAKEANASDPSTLFNLALLKGDFDKDYDAAITTLQTYTDANGVESEMALEHIASFQKEKKRADRKKDRDQEQAEREREKEERQKLLDEAVVQPAPWGEELPAENSGTEQTPVEENPWEVP